MEPAPDLEPACRERDEVHDVEPHEAEPATHRAPMSVFGPVVVSRSAYRAKGHANLCPPTPG